MGEFTEPLYGEARIYTPENTLYNAEDSDVPVSSSLQTNPLPLVSRRGFNYGTRSSLCLFEPWKI
jgi:hypothetical protein